MIFAEKKQINLKFTFEKKKDGVQIWSTLSTKTRPSNTKMDQCIDAFWCILCTFKGLKLLYERTLDAFTKNTNPCPWEEKITTNFG